jgi:hypothetical protein
MALRLLSVLPPGTHAFSVDPYALHVQSATGETFTAHILARLKGPTEFPRDGSLVFDKAGGGCILTEVWMLRTDGILLRGSPENYSRELFMFSWVLNQNPKEAGRLAYERTCSKCHGPTAKGDKEADKFFNITIASLSSDLAD